jgi:hypothetical protein
LYTYVPVAIKISTESTTASNADENSLMIVGRVIVLPVGSQNACIAVLLEVSVNESGLAV